MAISATRLTTHTASPKPPSAKIMARFLKRLGSLLEDGFSLQEAFQFLETLTPKEKTWLIPIRQGLESGNSLDEQLKQAGFPEHIVSRIYFASVHGNYARSIYLCGVSLEAAEKRKRKLLSLLAYPFLLVLFMTGLLLSMRTILLPHLQMSQPDISDSWQLFAHFTSSFVEYFPFLLTGTGGSLLLLWYWNQYIIKKIGAIQNAGRFARWPIMGTFVRLYYSQSFSQEWGQLFQSSLELHDIVQLMQGKNTSRLMKEVGEYLENELRKGEGFSHTLSRLPFFQPELSGIVLHGEATGHLGKELQVYSDACFLEMEEKMEKGMTLIQPLSFLFIAFLIISVYGAMLLPMLANMEGIL